MNSIQHYSSVGDLDLGQVLRGSQWTEQAFCDLFKKREHGVYFWNEANRRVDEQHASFHASPHTARSPHVAEQLVPSRKRTCTPAARVHTSETKSSSTEQVQMCTLDIVKHQYGQGISSARHLLSKLKKDVDDASDEDYLLWQDEEREQQHTAQQFTATQLSTPELYPTQAMRYIQAATQEHACSNSWAGTRTLPLAVTVGAVLHHALSITKNKPHDESTETMRSRISKQTKDATKAFITAIINIKNVEFIKEALAQTSCNEETLHWINATKDKLELARQTAQAKLQEYVDSASV
jgi:hypothetical protein